MIRDSENHELILTDKPNPHILITGKSGYGKTYLANRILENIVSQDKSVLVVDVSNSYTSEELRKNKFQFTETAFISGPSHKPVFLGLDTATPNKAAARIASAIGEAFGVSGYIQRSLLLQCCQEVFQAQQVFTFPALWSKLVETWSRSKSPEKDSVAKLLDRLQIIQGFHHLCVAMMSKGNHAAHPIEIFQFSDLCPQLREPLTVFCLSIIWEDIRERKGASKYHSLLLDEFQHISLKDGSVLNNILREGRKFNFQVILSTQYINSYSKEELAALMQVGTSFYFRPTDTELRLVEKALKQSSNHSDWGRVLTSLSRGQAILIGHYHIKGHSLELSDPIRVRAVAEGY